MNPQYNFEELFQIYFSLIVLALYPHNTFCLFVFCKNFFKWKYVYTALVQNIFIEGGEKSSRDNGLWKERTIQVHIQNIFKNYFLKHFISS